MTREELKALGIADESVNAIMVLHGKAMADATNKANAAAADSEAAKAELKKYQKGGELYNDPKEVERLKNFEKDTLSKAEREKKTAALTELFKGANASESAIKLLIKTQNLEDVKLGEDGKVENGSELLKSAKADYADLFNAGGSGAPHAHTEQEGNGSGKSKQVVY